jgi:uncharacterized membrane protein
MVNFSELRTEEDRASRRAVWLVLAFAAAIRFYSLAGKQLWLDEIIQAIHSAPQLSLGEVLRGVMADRGAAPLDYLIQHYLTRLVPPSEFTLRLPAALFGTVTIALLYRLLRILLDRQIAFVAAALYAVYPLHHHYSQEGRPYALFTLLTVCAYLCFWKLLTSGRWPDWLGYGVVTTAMLYSHYYGVFVVFSQVVFSCLLLSGGVWRTLPGVRKVDYRFLASLLGTAGVAAALFSPWPIFGARTIFGYEPEPVHFGYKLALSFVQELGDGSFPLSLILLSLAVWGAKRLWAEQRLGHLALLLCWGLLPVPLLFLLLYVKDYFFAIRQFLFLTPAMLALSSLGVVSLAERLQGADGRRKRQVITRLTLGVGAVSLLVIGLHIPDRREDLRGAGQFLTQNVLPGDAVVAPEIDGVLAYYFPQMGQHVQPPSALPELTDTAANRTVFVVGTAHMSAASKQLVDAALQKTSSRRAIALRDVEIIEIGNRVRNPAPSGR